MGRRSQGVRSSRTGSVKESDRKRMRTLDRQIAQLDWEIAIKQILNPKLAKKLMERREVKDLARCRLRHKFKGVEEKPT